MLRSGPEIVAAPVGDRLTMERSLARNAAYLTGAEMMGRVLLLAFFILLARVEGDAFIADYAIAMSFAVIAFRVVSLGADRIVTREVAVSRPRGRSFRRSVLTAQLAAWLVVTPVMVTVAILLDYSDAQVAAVAGFSLWVLFSAFFLATSGYAQGIERMDIAALMQVVSAVLVLILGTSAIMLGGGLLWVAMAMAFGRVLATLYGASALHLGFRFHVLPSGKRARELLHTLRLAAPFALVGVLAVAYQRIDVLMLAKYVSSSEVGQYASAYALFEALLLIPFMLAAATYPRLVRTLQSDPDDFGPLVGGTLASSLAIASVVAGFTAAFSPLIVRIVLGPEFAVAASLLSVLAWGLMLQSFNSMFGISLMASRHEVSLIPIALVALASNVFLNALLIPRFGATGAAIATLGSFAVSSSAHLFFVYAYRIQPAFGAVGVAVAALAPSAILYVFLPAPFSAVAACLVFGAILISRRRIRHIVFGQLLAATSTSARNSG